MFGTVLETLITEKALRSECRARAERVVTPEVLDPVGLAELGSKLFREGTIVCLVTERGTAIVERILAAIEVGDRTTIDRIGAELLELQKKGLRPRRREPNKRPPFFNADHLVDLRYGDVALGTGLAPSFVTVAVSQAVWNGGSLSHEKLTVSDYVRDKDIGKVKAWVVLVRPRLSDLERALLRSVPEKIDDAFVLGPSLSWTPVAEAGLTLPFGDVEGVAQFQRIVQEKTQQQIQQQQEDKQNQQQQQQQQLDNKQQQQQQQQQDLNQTNQQQQQQQQQADHQQQQQQQQQDANTNQEQQQNQQDANTNQQQQQQGSEFDPWWDDELAGVELGDFNQEGYLQGLQETNFANLDATQSAKVLLRLRERFLLEGLP